MKNFSKSNYSKNNSDRISRNSKPNQKHKSNNSQQHRSKTKKNNIYEKSSLKTKRNFNDNENKLLSKKEKFRDNSNQLEGKFISNNSERENYPQKNLNNITINNNARNFDDWIWGKHSVFEALNSKRPINRIWCTSDIFSSEKFFLLLKDLKSKGVLIEEVSWSRLSQLTSRAVHQGIALQTASKPTLSLDKLINSSKSKSKNPILVALDGITDPHNLGAIIRSAEAFDCKGIIIPQRRSAGLTGTVAKVAAGALEHIPVSRVVNLNRSLDELKKNGFLILGLSGSAQVPISEFDQKIPIVVVVGAENKGISLLTQKKCDYLLKIPLKGKTSSLNASIAAAISLCFLSKN